MEKTSTLKTSTAISFCVRKRSSVRPPTSFPIKNVAFTIEKVESSFAAKGTPPTRNRIYSDGYTLTKGIADTLTTKLMIVSPGVNFLMKWSIV